MFSLFLSSNSILFQLSCHHQLSTVLVRNSSYRLCVGCPRDIPLLNIDLILGLLYATASLHIDYPMLFELRNAGTERVSHCGVLEFIAEEGMIYMPYWVGFT